MLGLLLDALRDILNAMGLEQEHHLIPAQKVRSGEGVVVLVHPNAAALLRLEPCIRQRRHHGRLHLHDPGRLRRRASEAHHGGVVLRHGAQAHVPVVGHGQGAKGLVLGGHGEGHHGRELRVPHLLVLGLHLRLHRGRHRNLLRLPLRGCPARGQAPDKALPAPQVAAEDVARHLAEAQGPALLLRQPRRHAHLRHEVGRVTPELHAQGVALGRRSPQAADQLVLRALATLGQAPEG
mmetsp:Transcript_84269/g.272753  ORF Transcript_84269/g.272753 Transcript_84269/m.272753 type:complete len:237 (-) Transcript_84269:184-894(-)